VTFVPLQISDNKPSGHVAFNGSSTATENPYFLQLWSFTKYKWIQLVLNGIYKFIYTFQKWGYFELVKGHTCGESTIATVKARNTTYKWLFQWGYHNYHSKNATISRLITTCFGP
jgi:hypothetical protein